MFLKYQKISIKMSLQVSQCRLSCQVLAGNRLVFLMRLEELLDEVALIAREAGRVILNMYATPFWVQTKADASPVTEADEAAERLIIRRLNPLTPDVPIVSEEAAAAGYLPDVASRFWLVDALDGTKEFINRNGE